jgi:tRNA nucleotidyltransferase (CCA-adding enzyme)
MPGVAQAAQLDVHSMLELLEQADALRRPERFSELLLACEARSGDAAAGPLLQQARSASAAVALPREQLARLSGPEIAHALRAARMERLARLLRLGPDQSE